MKKYKVLIEETLARTVIVEAENEEQADEIVQNLYDNEMIVLTGEDYNGELVLGGEYTEEAQEDDEVEFTEKDMVEKCEYCGGKNGEHEDITTMETVYAGEPHQAPIGSQTCPNALPDNEDDYE